MADAEDNNAQLLYFSQTGRRSHRYRENKVQFNGGTRCEQYFTEQAIHYETKIFVGIARFDYVTAGLLATFYKPLIEQVMVVFTKSYCPRNDRCIESRIALNDLVREYITQCRQGVPGLLVEFEFAPMNRSLPMVESLHNMD